MALPSPDKDPRAVARGKKGMATRWGGGHVAAHLRLGDLTVPQRRLVLALVAAARAENEEAAPASGAKPGAVSEVRRVAGEDSTAA